MSNSANTHLNIDILSNEWQSDALLVSDWGSGSDLVPHGLCADRKEAALRCINARMEMDMQANIYTDYLALLVRENKVSEKQIDECVRSILRLKYRLGLFDNPYVQEDESLVLSDTETAVQVAEQSAILLKNNGILPLKGKNLRVLVCGPMADRKKEQLGTWVFDGDTTLSVTPLEAFLCAADKTDMQVQAVSGLSYSRDKNTAQFDILVEKACQSDVILFFCGEEAILVAPHTNRLCSSTPYLSVARSSL